MKKIYIFLFSFLLLFSLIGCEKKELILKGEDRVEVGSSIVLTHNFQNSADEIWESSDVNIAEVFDGMVIGNSVGNVTITLTIGEATTSKEITVVANPINITIVGQNLVEIGKSIKLDVELSKEIEEEIVWQSDDETIAKVNQNGLVRGISSGTTTIKASVLGNTSEFVITVIPKNYTIAIIGKNVMTVGEEYNFEYNDNIGNISSVVWDIDNKDVASITSDGLLVAKNTGEVVVTVYLKGNKDIFSSFLVKVVLPAPESIKLSGENKVVQGKTINLESNVTGDNVTKEVVWTSSNPRVAIVYQGIVLGVTAGTTVIKASSVVDENIYDSIEITVEKYNPKEESKDDLEKVNKIIESMTLSQKIGQMFVVGLGGTTMPNDLSSAIENYNFGNVIYMAYNVTNPNTLSKMSDDIQNKMLKENNVPGFITIDQEGGRVIRLTNGGTHFISNMALAATNDINNGYLEGQAIGKELRNYGINCDFAPVLDVNNNPENPIIGIRSYSDNPVLVSLFGNKMIDGLQESNVMACSKHFPGHGNTSVDSHYGLPKITSSYDELYQTELAPFISAIANGIDSIMTTHIIFSAIDEVYPATLSEKVLTDLLRKELGFNGVIYTDGMEMGAVTSNFGGHDKTAVLAVKAGVDILTYTSINNPKTAHKALMDAVKSGEISEERINESVRRILLKKLKYGLLDNCYAKNENINQLLKDNEKLNNDFAIKGLTQVKGEFNGLDKSLSTLLISPTSSYSLGDGLESNSFANYAYNYLKDNGHKNLKYLTVDKNITSSQQSEILNIYKNYDQIVIAMSNVKTSRYNDTIKLINTLTQNHKNVIVIALDTPYDLLSYNNVTNYICVYGYQKASVIALSKYLNGEFKAKGKSPINENLFN